MAKPEWGVKRLCASCGARFYDLQRDPALCPECGAAFDLEALTRVRRTRPGERAALKEVVVADVDLVDVDDEDEALVVDDEEDDALAPEDDEDAAIAPAAPGVVDDDLDADDDVLLEDDEDDAPVDDLAEFADEPEEEEDRR